MIPSDSIRVLKNRKIATKPTTRFSARRDPAAASARHDSADFVDLADSAGSIGSADYVRQCPDLSLHRYHYPFLYRHWCPLREQFVDDLAALAGC
jgi:hypothetical protein